MKLGDQTSGQYSCISILNHWITAVVFLGMLGFGFYLEYADLERAEKGPLFGIHKSIGFLFLLFAAWRISWRLYQGFPKAVGTMPTWQEKAAIYTHWLLLAAILLMPLSGVLGSVFGGRDIDVFGWFVVSSLGENDAIKGVAKYIHSTVPYVVSALLIAHIGAALKHHFIDKDETLKRMTGRNT